MPPSSPLLRCTPTSPSQPHTLSLHDALPIYQGHAHERVDDESLVEDDLHDVGERAGGGTIDVSAPRALLGRSGAGHDEPPVVAGASSTYSKSSSAGSALAGSSPAVDAPSSGADA